jgi:hypothetical protein
MSMLNSANAIHFIVLHIKKCCPSQSTSSIAFSHQIIRLPWPPTPKVCEVVQSQCFRSAEQTAVHRVNNRLCRDSPTTKEATVQALDSILPARDPFELEIDVTLRIRIQGNVDDMTVL